MDQSQFVEVETFIRGAATRLGVPELILDESLRERMGGSEGRAYFHPSVRVELQLEALERLLALFDRSVYEDSLRSIRASIGYLDSADSQAPQFAGVLIWGEQGQGRYLFSELPDLRALRLRLQDLIGRVREEGPGT